MMPERMNTDKRQKTQEMFNEGHIQGVILEPLERREDERGWLLEIFRQDELAEGLTPAMAYISQTLPGAARGPHEHREQTDMFAFIGPGDFKLYCWDTRRDSATFGNRRAWIVGESNRQAVIIPPGVVHAYKNIGTSAAIVINCPNRLHGGPARSRPVDEIRYENWPKSPYVLD